MGMLQYRAMPRFQDIVEVSLPIAPNLGHVGIQSGFPRPVAEQTPTAAAVTLAVRTAEIGGDGWESNPPRTPQQRPANGFEDPCGRVEYRTGPNGPLTQRSINRLGVRRIVFQ